MRLFWLLLALIPGAPAIVFGRWLAGASLFVLATAGWNLGLYLNLFVESADGGWWRLQSTWMVYNNNGVDEDLALGATGNSMRDNSEALDTFLDEQ